MMEMSKAERLNERVSELLEAAVQRVLEAVRDTVQEYEEKSTRAQLENDRLRRKVQQLQEQLDRDSAVSDITAQLTVSPSLASARQKKACPGGHSNPLALKDKPCFKEEPHNDSQSAGFPAQIKTELEHPDYPGAEEPVQEPVLQNTYYPCAHLQFQASQSVDPDFPIVLPCNTTTNTANNNTTNDITNTSAENLDTFVEHFPFEEESWRQQSRDERHVCLLCGKNFNRLANLRIHQRCHTGEKPYSCSHCGRRFSHSGNLQKHKRVHTGERPYQCPQCSKSFCQSSHLKKHQMVHVARHLAVTRRNLEL